MANEAGWLRCMTRWFAGSASGQRCHWFGFCRAARQTCDQLSRDKHLQQRHPRPPLQHHHHAPPLPLHVAAHANASPRVACTGASFARSRRFAVLFSRLSRARMPTKIGSRSPASFVPQPAMPGCRTPPAENVHQPQSEQFVYRQVPEWLSSDNVNVCFARRLAARSLACSIARRRGRGASAAAAAPSQFSALSAPVRCETRFAVSHFETVDQMHSLTLIDRHNCLAARHFFCVWRDEQVQPQKLHSPNNSGSVTQPTFRRILRMDHRPVRPKVNAFAANLGIGSRSIKLSSGACNIPSVPHH